MVTRRDFLKSTALGTAAITVGGISFPHSSYARIVGANDKIKVGVVGFSDRTRHTLIPSFQVYAEQMGFEIVAVSDIWKRRREEAIAFMKNTYGKDIKAFRNNEELYEAGICDAVIIATADFQHALHCIEAVKAGCDAYVEKPFAETMADNRAARQAVLETGRIVQIGSQRRSAPNYQAANEYIRSGKFGKVTMVEMSWNVNQPGRWRRPDLVSQCFEKDTDWKRFLMNRPYEEWDPRKYLEYRLFWPYSSGIPGQWMSHQIDTVHWFTGYAHPKSVVANGGIYQWNDGRSNADTLTAVFEYAGADASDAFQVVYSSRMHNSAGGVKELYFSNGGSLNLETNKVTSDGGLTERMAAQMGMPSNMLDTFDLPSVKVETAANTGTDPMTNLHMLNWMECIKSRKQPNAPVDAGYNHSIATIMCTASLQTGEKVTFDETTQEVKAGGKVFTY
ncbi:putative dehydrogenase [Parabacteroides sp. PF5-5]|uniref:Gfo/Idh/MocA family oxidoreductase n=1 Tax=unclassified Parabacteroides TaxID=2649774 RepID=UPI002476CB16|nr:MULTISPECIES: Gfo/Idh/MocA family oxidoreductase [unclassified Parabacteroides]MDH6305875.1 putative dehydrogenase [Parabacteroides sp. PH5-39]MDH6317311.1 putative dehydrogenase [Parabacteroides sp. PF5-13]MDH6320519.1 putative dehydrogenase [Parabacteroides sp. PH5-13]MDH6324318.1 putative dehydrogenase [Parabacteroides sp. PH5-8]MDH6328515.1 putative dehydrogenase [Parabacteroides sp. PH5-41]